MKIKGIIVLVLVASLFGYYDNAKAANYIYYSGSDLQRFALTESTTTNNIPRWWDAGVAPGKGDGWHFEINAPYFVYSFLDSGKQGENWGNVAVYVDGKLNQVNSQGNCQVQDQSGNCLGVLADYRVDLPIGYHVIDIQNTGDYEKPINLFGIYFSPVLTNNVFMPMVNRY